MLITVHRKKKNPQKSPCVYNNVPTDIKLLSSKTKYNMCKAVVLGRIDQTIINYLPHPTRQAWILIIYHFQWDNRNVSL